MSTFLTIVLIVVAAAALYRVFGGYGPRPAGFKNLSRAEVAAVKSVSDALFPAGGAIEPSGDDAGVAEYIDDYIGRHAPMTRTLMHLLFFLVEHATIIFLPSWKRLSQLSENDRLKYLEGWEQSRFYARRLVFNSLRTIACMAYCADEEVSRQMGVYRPQSCAEQALEG